MNDVVEKVKNSMIHHGKFNNRIYLMKLSREDFPDIINDLDNIAMSRGYTKIFAKVPPWAAGEFDASGYRKEGFIPEFFNGSEDVFFMGKYFDAERAVAQNENTIKDVIHVALNKKNDMKSVVTLEQGFDFRIAQSEDAEQMAKVYGRVFETYPFPIHNPEYIKKTMDENIVYFGIWQGGQLVAVSSCEMYLEDGNVEMTDFASLSEFRGKGFAQYLLNQMEQEMIHRGMKTAYTIARSVSYGMNITFARRGYKYSGTLINNTNISGNMESMNIWYKSLNKPD